MTPLVQGRNQNCSPESTKVRAGVRNLLVDINATCAVYFEEPEGAALSHVIKARKAANDAERRKSMLLLLRRTAAAAQDK